MNLHVPQTINAEVETGITARCANHIVTSQKNGPISGIVQDGLISVYILTMTWKNKNDITKTMVDRDIVYQIYKEVDISESRISDLKYRAKKYYPEYITDDNDFSEEIPGNIFISIIFPHNLCYERRTDVNKIYPTVLIEDGILLPNSGPLCKKSVGASNSSIIHWIWKESVEYALYILSEIQQITDRWLPTHGFTMGISDCIASSSDAIAKTLIETRTKVSKIVQSTDSLNKTEGEINNVLNNAMAVGPKLAEGSMMKGDRNALNIMRNSGAKGSVINLAQITAFVGQQNIRGGRMPMTLSHNRRCLPSFLPGDTSPDARGFVEDNYITGLTPQAAFFHAAAGRDGIISTALKSITGETDIVISVNGCSKKVKIGDWIDELLFANNEDVQKYDEREMELLNISKLNIHIPTCDENGNVSWGFVKNITRHDPGKKLFRIKTLSGREVIVTESKSLLIWDKISGKFVKKNTEDVNIGDFVPTTLKLEIDNNISLPFINTKKHLLFSNITGFIETTDSIYYNGDSLPIEFELNYENGLFTGVFLACGKYDVRHDYGSITLNTDDEDIKKFIRSQFVKYGNTTTSNYVITNEKHLSCYSKILAVFLSNFIKNSKMPDEVYSAPKDFVSGVISGYFSRRMIINTLFKTVEIQCINSVLAESLSMLLSRFGIFSSIIKTIPLGFVDLVIDNNYLSKFSQTINLLSKRKHLELNFFIKDLNLRYISNDFVEKHDIILDSVVSIEKIEIKQYMYMYPKYKGKVYDLTIPSTLNFGLANGLHVVDTADTGYVQKRLARKMEDCKVALDGTVRNANNSVISFMYGGDGMDAKKLVSVKGLNHPFFVNPGMVARKLNSDAKQTGEVQPDEEPRRLRDVEIELLINNISFTKINTKVIKNVNSNIINILRRILQDVKIYECKIPDFCVSINDAYINSKAQYGTMVGLLATASMGEPTTQMVLNVFHLAGFKGKDASLGVPRFKELINVTKTADQRNPGCTIYFTYPYIINNAKSVSELEKKPNKAKLIKRCKEESLSFLQLLKKDFEETFVGDFIETYNLKYINENKTYGVSEITSPLNILQYKKYEESWWVTLSKDTNFDTLEFDPSIWIIILDFNVEKMFNRRIELEDIARVIEENGDGQLKCIISPNALGKIEVYVSKDYIKTYAKSKIVESKNSLITDKNIDYFVCRDALVTFIKNIQVSGISGIFKTYPREDLETHEWVMDTDGANFLKVLSMPNVDTTRTTVDDIHTILSTLGIEAARRFLFLELTRVISFDGTYINPRHVAILADVMTVSGILTPASRYGIGREIGPNAKIMFEKPVDNAMKASAFGELDKMVSLSSSVMYGKVAKAGPGVVNIKKK